ncbi:MAG: sugar transferase [Anaerolineae bacterium]|nr:sugar transferase [Anaerolineae bacterium]
MTWLVVERPGVKLYNPIYYTIKRMLDLILCLIALPVLAPLGLLIAILIRLDSPGPILFIQERIGKGGRPFKIYKFRTMYYDINRNSHQMFMKAFVQGHATVDNERQVFKPFNKSQITPIGRILRKTSLDELPQLINIFKGEMSLVGPRPNVLWEVEEYHGWHKERLEVLPGITGLAQIKGRSGIVFDEIVRYDIEYIERQGLWFDIKILWCTFVSVLMGKGAH